MSCHNKVTIQGGADGVSSVNLDMQAQQALSVSLNKLGDLQYLQGNLGAAREFYSQALQVASPSPTCIALSWSFLGPLA